MDYLREAFKKIKDEMSFLGEELNFLKEDMDKNTQIFAEFTEILGNLKQEIQDLKQEKKEIISTDRQTLRQTQNRGFSTDSTHSSTHNILFKPLETKNIPFSTGNQGVSTDRQTDTSTDRQTQKPFEKQGIPIKNAVDFLDSLDNLKKEIRLKFKCITEQEFLVFSTIYHLDEEYGGTDYKELAKKLDLTESSIRDYIGRLLKKNIPIQKRKINNKNVQLSISKDLKKIASLSTILQLREI